MILRRNGDSHLVNVEFEDKLQGCKKPMSRDLTGLMTHKKSGVAGHSASADVDETVMLEVILLRLLWMRKELQVQQSNCPSVKLWRRRSRLKFPLLHCIVHVSLEGAEKLHNLFTSVVMRQSL